MRNKNNAWLFYQPGKTHEISASQHKGAPHTAYPAARAVSDSSAFLKTLLGVMKLPCGSSSLRPHAGLKGWMAQQLRDHMLSFMQRPGFHHQLTTVRKVLELDCAGMCKQYEGYRATFIVCLLESKLSVLVPVF